MHKLDLGLYFHPKEFLGNGVRTHVNSKGKIPATGGSEEGGTCDACIMQDSKPNTLPAELFQPNQGLFNINSLLFRHGNWPWIRGFPLEEKNVRPPQNKTVRSNLNVMVLHQVKNRQNWKMQGCFMQFLRLIFVKKLQLQRASPPDLHQGRCPLGPHWRPSAASRPPLFS